MEAVRGGSLADEHPARTQREAYGRVRAEQVSSFIEDMERRSKRAVESDRNANRYLNHVTLHLYVAEQAGTRSDLVLNAILSPLWQQLASALLKSDNARVHKENTGRTPIVSHVRVATCAKRDFNDRYASPPQGLHCSLGIGVHGCRVDSFCLCLGMQVVFEI